MRSVNRHSYCEQVVYIKEKILNESPIAVYAAIAVNIAIMTFKLIVFYITGSSAMLAEGVHSFVDILNGSLLLLGAFKSKGGPDSRHPLGHGKEVYFWAFVVSVSLFGLGGGVSIYEGILKILTPHEIENVTWNYIVIGGCLIFETISWLFAFFKFRFEKGEFGLIESIHRSKDPTTFAVLFEDTAAIAGLVIAAAAIYCSATLQKGWIDGLGSILIGLVLIISSMLLGRETKGLLIGEGALIEKIEKIVRLAAEEPGVEKVDPPFTLQFGPDTILVNLKIYLKQGTSAKTADEHIRGIRKRIKECLPTVSRISIEVGVTDASG